MKSILFLMAATLMPAFFSVCVGAEGETSPMDIKFNRQAVRRLVFDQDQAIPLSTLNPAKIVKRSIEYPTIALSEAGNDYAFFGSRQSRAGSHRPRVWGELAARLGLNWPRVWGELAGRNRPYSPVFFSRSSNKR